MMDIFLQIVISIMNPDAVGKTDTGGGQETR